MAEKSSQLDRINASDAISTSAGADQDELLESRADDYTTSDYTATDSDTLEAASDDTDEATDDTEEIRAQIVETRSQMGETIDAIQEKLSLQNISEQVKEQVSEHINSAIETAKESVYGATIGNLGKAGKFMQNIGKEISRTEAGKFARKNPFPLVLIGLGVGLLAYEGFSRGGGRNRRTYRYSDYDNDRRDRGYRDSGTIGTLKSATGKIGDTASHAYESVSETTGQALESVKGAASNAYGTVTDTANKAYSSVTDYAGTAYEKVGEYGTVAREKYDYYLEENPLAVGAVALAVGAAVGLAIPATRYESEMMGEYSSQLLDRAQTAAGGLVDRVKEVAAEAKTTLSDEVKTTLSETKKTITEEAKNQGFISEEPKDAADFKAGKTKTPGTI
ncbi:MAG TPA: DUF3618 domain-containing protein [Pyrinomonadaceae bacterium]|jgi:ElaB/YqjD/DUF883 family membrane-anchored ribosome-binding protein